MGLETMKRTFPLSVRPHNLTGCCRHIYMNNYSVLQWLADLDEPLVSKVGRFG